MENGKIAPQTAIDEMKALVQSGDINLAEERVKFKKQTDRETTLNDDDLLEAIAATTDDDPEEFAENCITIEDRNKTASMNK
jgi:hypothetical protein